MKVKPRLESPCKNCKSRYIGCHDECVDYTKYKRKKEEINELSYKERCKEYMLRNYEVDCATRVVRKQGRKPRW